MSARLEFHGVRGSIPTPGADTLRTGGNTSCAELSMGGERIILDGGTGLRRLGAIQGATPLEATILFSHLHWDHIQGIPFCGPLYLPGSRVTLVGPRGLRAALDKQMSGPTFPVGMEAFAARIRIREIEPGEAFPIGRVRVSTCALNHPGGAMGYRLACDAETVVYALDHEHGDPEADRALTALATGADLLVADAQYTPNEYPARRGWGHSTWEQACALAKRAEVTTLVLDHHDPSRSDAQVSAIEQRARRLHADTWAAREGKSLCPATQAEAQTMQRALESYLATALAAG